MVAVENTGARIPARELARLFEPFEQIQPADTRLGLGLGLAVVKAVADAHDARVSARVRMGGGLRVEVAFPVATEPIDSVALSRSRTSDDLLAPPAARRLATVSETRLGQEVGEATEICDGRPVPVAE